MRNLILGTVQFGEDYGISNKSGVVKLEAVKKILNLAKTSKIQYLDTAISYTKSNYILGKCDISNFKIISKLPEITCTKNLVKEYIEKSLNDLFLQLRVNNIDTLLLHRPLQIKSEIGEEIIKVLYDLKTKKLFNKIGASFYSPIEFEKIEDQIKLDVVQAPYSILDQRFKVAGILEKLNSRGIEFHARSIFLQGLLLIPKEELPLNFKIFENIFEYWTSYLNENNMSPIEACLKFVKNNTMINNILIGVQNEHQLLNILDTKINLQIPEINWPDELSEDLLNPNLWETLK